MLNNRRPFWIISSMLLLFIVAIITLSACQSMALQPSLNPTKSLSSGSDVKQLTPTVYSTTLSENGTAVPTILTHTDQIKLTVSEIESGYTDAQVVTGFWSADGNFVYYAYAASIGAKPLRWATYDIATRDKMNVSSPLKFDSQIWQRLGIHDPLDNLALYPELLGYMSPSGEHVIYTINKDNNFATPRNPNPVTEIWIADSNARHKIKLLEMFPGIINHAVWLRKETRVLFDFGAEGSVRLYIADVQNGEIRPLTEISDFNQGTEQHWDVSPDGAILSIIDLRGTLWLVSLEDKKSIAVDKFTRSPSWSVDGKYLYYWWGSSYDDTHLLRSYEVTTGNISTVVDQSILVSSFNGLRPTNFVVSPDQSKIIFWGGGLWLVKLHG